ncbi:PREDICTED: spermatogenesis-associated protein 25 [Gekko japonicus]|uniref:Spermatogenesis-associated protein 25 n=1 Tax=Gekko japonicus TaxID=146911 RepID=A0ABM1K270_GEKJA|nr:PREDICTED: spermatogenesis-associated protein 25 [Gekko japonicus]
MGGAKGERKATLPSPSAWGRLLELKLAPGGPPRLSAAAPSAGGVSAPGLFRRKPPAGRGPPPQGSTAPLLPEPDLQPPCRGVCLSPGAPHQGVPRGSSRRPPHLGPAGQAGRGCLCLPPAAPHPLGQQVKDNASPRGDPPLARWWGFLPSGLVWMSAPLDPEGGASPPALCPPPNICILTLAMMIAGIPTVPVPGVREEDLILAARDFMAGSPRPSQVASRWPFRQGRPAAAAAEAGGRSLFLAQLEK